MIKLLCVIFMALVVLQKSCAKLDESFVVDFFAAKSCTVGTIFSCLSKKEQIILTKSLVSRGLRISYFSVGNQTWSVETVLARKSHSAVVLDGFCDNLQSFLNECAEMKLFYDTYHWLVFGSNRSTTQIFKGVGLNINADVSVAVLNNERKPTSWTIMDVYNPAGKHGGELKVEDVGFYNQREGYQVKIKGNKYFRRRDMTGVVFKTAMVIPENISMTLDEYLASDRDRHNNSFSRFNSVTVRNCKDFYNFGQNRSVIQSWGYEQPNGDVDGMVKALKEKTIDFGDAALIFRLYRLKAVDYGYGNWIMRSVFIFRHPKTTLSSYELYVRPLVGSVWISIALAIILTVIALRFAVTKEIWVLKGSISGGETSWSFLLLYSIGELCQQGFSYIPTLASGRIVIITVLIFCFLIYQFYSASVVSFLLLDPPRTINTLSDLLKSPLKAGCENSLFDIDYLIKTTDPVAIQLYNTKIKGAKNSSNFFLPEEGLKKVEAGGFAFHAQTSTAYPIIDKMFTERAICELAEVPMYRRQHVYMSLQKHSPFTEMFNYCMVHQTEVGIMNRLRRHWTSDKPQCLQSTNYLEIEVGLTESYWALILLGFGIFVSLIVLTVEHMWAKNTLLKKKICGKSRKWATIEPFVN